MRGFPRHSPGCGHPSTNLFAPGLYIPCRVDTSSHATPDFRARFWRFRSGDKLHRCAYSSRIGSAIISTVTRFHNRSGVEAVAILPLPWDPDMSLLGLVELLFSTLTKKSLSGIPSTSPCILEIIGKDGTRTGLLLTTDSSEPSSI